MAVGDLAAAAPTETLDKAAVCGAQARDHSSDRGKPLL